MTKTNIEWSDEVWNCVRGCSRVSDGCQNCYAEQVARRFAGPGQPYEGLVRLTKEGKPKAQWNGTVRFIPEHLADPLSWRKPRRVFVNSMSDLFHEGLAFEDIAAIFGVMAACPQHTFQILTKRPERAREFFEQPGIRGRVDFFRHIALAGRIEEFFAEERVAPIDGWSGYWVTSRGRVLSDNRGNRREMRPMAGEAGHQRVMLYRDGGETLRPLVHRLVLTAFGGAQSESAQGCHIDGDPRNNALWNLRWGTSSENWADSKRHGTARRYSKMSLEQVADLRRMSAEGVSGAELGRRFGISDTQARNIATGKQWPAPPALEWPLPEVWVGVSVENQATADERIPVLLSLPAAVRWVSFEPGLGPIDFDGTAGGSDWLGDPRDGLDGEPGIDWIVVGGESGHGARPFDIAWARSTIEQCRAAGVACFVKQLGAAPILRDRHDVSEERFVELDANGWDEHHGPPTLRNRKGGEPREWPEDLRVREYPR